MSEGSLREFLLAKKILTCVGSGGVGKTTTAAALAVFAARSGRETAVLTIDPARRLQDSLGVNGLSAEPVAVPLGPGAQGTLEAMRLDVKQTFDGLVRRFAPNPAMADRILSNRLYHTISNGLAGSLEYMAMEKLYEIASGSRYDLVVLDTPPTRHALDFLKAPERMLNLLNSRAASILRDPQAALSATGSRVANSLIAAILRSLERFTGLEVLHELSEFVAGFEGMIGGFSERAQAVAEMLRSPDCAFLLVTTADRSKIEEALSFAAELGRANLPVAGFVVNRMLPAALVPTEFSADPGSDRFLAKLNSIYVRLREAVAREQDAIEGLGRSLPRGWLLAQAPALPSPPNSIAGLELLGKFLCR